MSNYTLIDSISIISKLIVWCIVSGAQGYVIGYISNVLDFRNRPFLHKVGLAMTLSMSIMPCIYYLLASLGGLRLDVALSLGMVLAFLVIVFVELKKKEKDFFAECKEHGYIFIALAIWLALGLLINIDWQAGNKLFLSMTIYDHAGKVAIADAIGRTGVPPSNPMFYPGHQVALYYYYYWPLFCSVISSICGSAYNTRDTVYAGILWTGCIFIAMVALSCSYFTTIRKTAVVSTKKIVISAITLLLVSNWYALIVVPGNINAWLTKQPLAFLNINWVSEDQISTFIPSMLWVPHHIAGLIAGLLASILILEASRLRASAKKTWHIILAGISLASCLGLSIYLAIGFSISWAIWALAGNFSTTFSASLLSLILSLPFILEQERAHHAHIPLEFGVRKFEVINFTWPNLLNAPDWQHQLAYFFALPFNYLFGFGFILIGALYYWENRWHNKQKAIKDKERFLLIITFVGLVLGSFMRTNIQANDFGWRIIMLPYFAFLLWSAQYVAQHWKGKIPKLSLSSWIFIVIGLFTLTYGLYLDRTAAIYAVQTPTSEECFAYRSIYEDLDKQLAYGTIMQHNPIANFWDNEPFYCHYSHRQAVACDEHHGWLMGPTYEEYNGVWQEVKKLFENPSAAQAEQICHKYKIDVLLVKNHDPIWSDKKSWVWHYPVLKENAYARAFSLKAKL